MRRVAYEYCDVSGNGHHVDSYIWEGDNSFYYDKYLGIFMESIGVYTPQDVYTDWVLNEVRR